MSDTPLTNMFLLEAERRTVGSRKYMGLGVKHSWGIWLSYPQAFKT